jgi:diguanylate cyclase (GGDEF)-like protein
MPNAVESRGPLEDLRVFHELARSLTSSLDLNSILNTILGHMERLIDAELWALLMLDRERQELYYYSGDAQENSRPGNPRIKVGEGLAGWVVQHGETLIIPETSPDARLAISANGRGFSVRSAIGLPIRGRKGVHGVLEIFNPRLDDNSDYTISFLHILADFAAIAIENAQDVARAHELTLIDDVTGLYNARHLYTVLEQELEIARKDSKALSIVFIDLDRFKQVNDLHGHLVGSDLLGRVGKRIRELANESDICFRYGGDEFVILMPGATREEAVRHARAIHAKLDRSTFPIKKGLELSVGASAGVASYPADGRTVHSILGTADKRMYEVKSTGRGRVGS